MQKASLLYLAVILLLISCQKERFVKLAFSSDNEFPILEINDTQAKNPITISGGAAGSIFFETSEGKVFLQGKPNKVSSNAQLFQASWKQGSRVAQVKVEKLDGHYSIALTAQPYEDILVWGISINASEDEYFTGLFERTVDGNQKESWKQGITEAMNLRGQSVEMIIKPTLSLYCPFYLSSDGYGLFVEGTWPGKYDFCKTNPDKVHIEFEGSSFSARLYTSAQPAEIVKTHSLHVGPTIVPPKWAFLPWRWRDNHVNEETYYDGTPVKAPYNSQLVEDVLMMQAYDIPCGVYWVDRPWAKGTHGYADFEWDPERFPKAENMLKWIHAQDMKFLLWIAPWVTGNMMQEAHSKGYSQAMVSHYSVDSSNAALLDFTNPEACTWWQEKGIEKMLKQGVDGFKLDRSEEIITESRDVILKDGRTSREVRNEYPVLYVKTVNESCRKIKGDDFVLIPRAGYTGSSKYSGFWGGDIGSPPEGLRAAIIAVQRSAIIGFPIWGSDIGGYWQGDLDREVCARWLAFGCFNPIMEFGPTEDRAPWNMDSEPHYDQQLIAIWRMYAKIHSQLADYSYQLAQEAHETGMPPVRPLFLTYPDQVEAWTEWQTYLYGPDILVHAIWEKGIDKCLVYIPAGDSWKDAWNPDKIYEGGQTVEIKSSIEKIPIFIREGSSIDLGDLNSLFIESFTIAGIQPDLAELEKLID